MKNMFEMVNLILLLLLLLLLLLPPALAFAAELALALPPAAILFN